jgi:putative hydrolase of HD superfamily
VSGSDRLAAQLAFLVEIDRLKTVLRRSPLIAADRRENSAEHSWHLAMLVLVLAEYAEPPVNVMTVVKLVLVHDLIEIYAGDTFVYDADAVSDQHERELRAAERLFPLLPSDQAAEFRALWEEFEARETPESRFAGAVDRVQPLLLNVHNEGGTWRTPGVTAAQVRQRMAVIADAAPALWDYCRQRIEEAVRRGWLAQDDADTESSDAGDSDRSW